MSSIKNIAIIDIGSKSIRMILADKLKNGLFNIKCFNEIRYNGYEDSHWIDANELAPVIKELIFRSEETVKIKLNKIFIGVPAEFTTSTTSKKEIIFKNSTRITKKHTEYLLNNISSAYAAVNNYYVLNVSPVEYVLDNLVKTLKPVRNMCQRLSVTASVILCDKDFINLMDDIFLNLKMVEVDYVSIPLSDCTYLFNPPSEIKQDNLLNIGYKSTTLTSFRGEGIEYMKSFSMGGGYFESDLRAVYNISYEIASMLLEKVNIALNYSEKDDYELVFNNERYRFSANDVNNCIMARIDTISEYIQQCLDESTVNIPPYLPLYLTGGGLIVKGCKDYLSKRLNRNIEYIYPNIPEYDKPYYTTPVGLVFVAEKTIEKRKGLIKKILLSFGGNL